MEKRKFQWVKGDRLGKTEFYKNTIQENGIDYLAFESGKRVTTDLIGDYIVELGENGEQFISSDIFQPQTILNSDVAPKQTTKKKTNTKADNYSLSDLIKDQLDKNNEFIKINIDIPVLKKDLYKMLMDTNSDLLNDLTKIVILKYINRDSIEESVKKKMNLYYSGKEDFEKTDFIDIVTEKL